MARESWSSSQSKLKENRFWFHSPIPVKGFRRNRRSRYSTRSLRPNPTAPAWDFASVGQSLSLMAGACGPRPPPGAERRFSSPYQLRLQTVINYLTVRLLSGIRTPRDTGGVFLRGFGATHGSPERRSNGRARSFTFANLRFIIRSTISAHLHDLHGPRRSHRACMSL